MTSKTRTLVLLPGYMCDADLWTDMLPGLTALGAVQHGNVYADNTLDGMARRVLAEAPQQFVLVHCCPAIIETDSIG